MIDLSLGELRNRRDSLRARLVWTRRDHEEYRRLDRFIKHVENLRRGFKEVVDENLTAR
jgi:hypothetical protein